MNSTQLRRIQYKYEARILTSVKNVGPQFQETVSCFFFRVESSLFRYYFHLQIRFFFAMN